MTPTTLRMATLVGVLAIALFTSAPSAPSAAYWVSVGTFATMAAAERLAAEADGKGGLDFAPLAADTAQGSLYRVAAGPFATRADADAGVRAAVAAGFSGAWVAVQDAPPARSSRQEARRSPPEAPPAVSDEPRAGGSSVDAPLAGDVFPAELLIDELPPIEELLEDLPELPSEDDLPHLETPAAEPPPQDIVVPDDYRLNRLHRDARAR